MLQLQQQVRAAFMHHGRLSAAMTDFMAGIVRPSIEVQAFMVANRTKEQAELALKLQSCFASGRLSGISHAEIKVATAVACGSLQAHPVLQGILVAAIGKAQRLSQGKASMHGAISAQDQHLAVDAACTIAMNGGNARVCRMLGADHGNCAAFF